ncbi:unannotated protein [freshwater metagenome]|uniref:Unannotated protein n=1 Tax=freshwater metagenome TaxID=449393 RepID=A0A6J7BUM1_9ZZZZ
MRGIEEALVVPGDRHDVVGVPVGALGAVGGCRIHDAHPAHHAVEFLRVAQPEVMSELMTQDRRARESVRPRHPAGSDSGADGAQPRDATTACQGLEVDEHVLARALDPANLGGNLVPEGEGRGDTAAGARSALGRHDGRVGGRSETDGACGDGRPVVVDAGVHHGRDGGGRHRRSASARRYDDHHENLVLGHGGGRCGRDRDNAGGGRRCREGWLGKDLDARDVGPGLGVGGIGSGGGRLSDRAGVSDAHRDRGALCDVVHA